MIAAVTDLRGRITGAHRTWLSPDGPFRPPGWGKAPVETPRRAMGELLGHAVRFGRAADVMAAGEGIETVLALRMALPPCPWPRRSPRRTSPRSRCRRACAGSTWRTTTTPPERERGIG